MIKKNFAMFLIIIVAVIVGAYFVLSAKNPPRTEPPKTTEEAPPEPESVPEVVAEVSEERTTYVDQEHRFSIEYPSNWMVVDLPDPKAGISFKSPSHQPINLGGIVYSNGEIYVRSIPNPQDLSLEKIFDTFSDTSKFWFNKFQHESIVVEKLSGEKFPKFRETDSLPYQMDVYIDGDKQVISFTYFSASGEFPYQDVFDGIVASLRFVD